MHGVPKRSYLLQKKVYKSTHIRYSLTITAIIVSSQDMQRFKAKSGSKIKIGQDDPIIEEHLEQVYAYRYMHRKLSSMTI